MNDHSERAGGGAVSESPVAEELLTIRISWHAETSGVFVAVRSHREGGAERLAPYVPLLEQLACLLAVVCLADIKT